MRVEVACLLSVVVGIGLSGCRTTPEPRVGPQPSADSRAALAQIPEFLRTRPRIEFVSMQEGDVIRGTVLSFGCWHMDPGIEFTCTFEDAARAEQRRWQFVIETGGGSASVDSRELQLDAVEVLDLDWELQYARLGLVPAVSSTRLEYWIEWWRDGHLMSKEHLLDQGGGSGHRVEALTLSRLHSIALAGAKP